MVLREKQNQCGFLTLEILIALTVMIFAISAAVLMSFSGQSLAADSQISLEAQNLAQKLIEEQRILAKNDFRLVNATSTQEGIFKADIKVVSRDFFVKNVSVEVGWSVNGRPQKIELTTLIADYNGTAGNDTCDSNLFGDWTHPQIKNMEMDFAKLIKDNSGEEYPITDVDAYRNMLYVTVNNSGASTSTVPTFFVFNISDPANFKLIKNGYVDNNLNINSGLNAVAVDGRYAYVAAASSKQLQVIDIGAMPPVIVADYKISNGGYGNSIFYKNNHVYLGLTKKGAIPEFYIIDVKKLFNGQYPIDGDYLVGNDINAIYVKENYIYLATPNSNNLIVLDSNMKLVGKFSQSGSSNGNGKSLYIVGDKLYLGRTVSGGKEFYILNNSDPENIYLANPNPAAKEIGMSVDGIITRDHLAFLLEKTNFQVLKIGDLANWGSTPFNSVSGETIEPSFDCEGNNFFIGSNNNGKGYLSVITAK